MGILAKYLISNTKRYAMSVSLTVLTSSYEPMGCENQARQNTRVNVVTSNSCVLTAGLLTVIVCQ